MVHCKIMIEISMYLYNGWVGAIWVGGCVRLIEVNNNNPPEICR